MRAPRWSLLLALLLHMVPAHAWAAGWLEIIDFIVDYFSYIAVATEIAYSAYSTSEQQRKAKNAYNDSLTDHTVTVRGAVVNRRMVLGKARVGGVVAYIGSTGVNKEKMVLVIALAAHECEAIDEIYFNDAPVLLDPSDGLSEFVATIPYSTGNNNSITDRFIGDGSQVTFTLTEPPVLGTVSAVTGTSTGDDIDLGVVAVSGSTVTIATAYAGSFAINYQTLAVTSHARVRKFLGAPGQVVDPVVSSMLPAAWDASHKMSGCAGLVVIFDYNEDAFQGKAPDVSAIVRGAKCYDPRLDSTAGGTGPHRVTDSTTWTFSENPAVLIGYAAMSPLCGRQPASAIRWDDIAAAANVCDTQVDYATWGQLTDENGNFISDENGNLILV